MIHHIVFSIYVLSFINNGMSYFFFNPEQSDTYDVDLIIVCCIYVCGQ